jgi:hypothetical protein
MTCEHGYASDDDRFCGQCGVPLVALLPEEVQALARRYTEAAREHALARLTQRCPFCEEVIADAPGHVVSELARGIPMIQCPKYPAGREPTLITPGRGAP